MNFKDYQAEASKTIPKGFTKEQMIENAIYGLVGEFGEVMDLLKKAKFQGHKLDKEKAILELGDVLWYLAELATGADCDMYLYYKTSTLKDVELRDDLYIINDFSSAMCDLTNDAIPLIEGKRNSLNIDAFHDIFYNVISLTKKFDTTINKVAIKNIEKLRARYGDKFDPEKSVNRND